MSNLIGRSSIVTTCTLVNNRIYIQNILTLSDSGANRFVFIDKSLAANLLTYFNIRPQRIKNPITPKGYTGAKGTKITYLIIIDIILDRRRLKSNLFLILELGNYDVILGSK